MVSLSSAFSLQPGLFVEDYHLYFIIVTAVNCRVLNSKCARIFTLTTAMYPTCVSAIEIGHVHLMLSTSLICFVLTLSINDFLWIGQMQAFGLPRICL